MEDSNSTSNSSKTEELNEMNQENNSSDSSGEDYEEHHFDYNNIDEKMQSSIPDENSLFTKNLVDNQAHSKKKSSLPYPSLMNAIQNIQRNISGPGDQQKFDIIKNELKMIPVRLVGKGFFGSVFQAICPHKGQVAVKLLESSNQENTKREAELLSKLRHNNIVKCYDFFPQQGAIVMEYCENGSLDQFLMRRT